MSIYSCVKECVKTQKKETIILFDNDVHCAVDIYSHISALRDSLEKEGKNVYTVSSGDFLSGGNMGNYFHGKFIVDIMNCARYDVITIGNHEFDFGIETLKNRMDSLHAKIVCCNFLDLRLDKQIFEGNTVLGDVAFIGVTTPTVLTSSSPKNFRDENMNYLYGFCSDSICKLVQRNVDEAKSKGARHIIILSHLGNSLNPILTSTELIRKTNGIDAVLDGHEHNVIECDTILNSDGKPVLLSSTGAYFKNIGILSIDSKGNIKTRLREKKTIYLKDYRIDSIVVKGIENFNNMAANQIIGSTSFDLSIMNYSGSRRAVRSSETNLGDLIADAFRESTGADIGIINSGSIRNNINRGEITFNKIQAVCPFENHVSVIKVSGQSILDAIEMATMKAPKESGAFFQVAGISYEIDTRIETEVKRDSTGILLVPENCRRRVRNVRVLDRKDGIYKPLHSKKEYTVAGIEFILTDKGDGISFAGYKTVMTSATTDVQIIAEYIRNDLHGIIDQKYARPGNRISIVEEKKADSKKAPDIIGHIN